MKSIGLAILYITILEQSNMNFDKKYNKQFLNYGVKESKFLDFIFDDFLQS